MGRASALLFFRLSLGNRISLCRDGSGATTRPWRLEVFLGATNRTETILFSEAAANSLLTTFRRHLSVGPVD